MPPPTKAAVRAKARAKAAATPPVDPGDAPVPTSWRGVGKATGRAIGDVVHNARYLLKNGGNLPETASANPGRPTLYERLTAQKPR